MSWRTKFGTYVLILAAIAGIVITILAAPSVALPPQQYGVTFSVPHASGIGLDWQETYLAVLNDLGVRHLRLAAYWDTIEPANDQFDFTNLDWQMDQAAQANAKVVLSVGRKLPRWPECHTPAWAAALPEPEQQAQVLDMLQVVIERYQNHPALTMWQLENEPLFDFGHCPAEDRQFLRQEEALLQSLDPNHPILITDSGELSSWLGAAQYGTTLGTTMYRTVFSGRTEKLFHYDYIFPAWLYRLKSRYVKVLTGKDVLISELQAEPWGSRPFPELSATERQASFSPDRFQELHHFARRTQLPIAYWWGVEYWYWEKEVNNIPDYWDYARQIF